MKKWLLLLSYLIGLFTIVLFVDQFKLLAILSLTVLCLLIFISSLVNIRWNFYFRSINNTKGKGVLITFDDGPDQYTSDILDILKKNNVKAMFFLIGSKIENQSPLIKRMVDEGHVIGNHSYHHSNLFPTLSVKKMTDEVRKTNELIQGIQGNSEYFRPPFGVCNPTVGKVIRKERMQSVGWTIRTFDTQKKSAEKLKQSILQKVNSNSIILFHYSQEVTRDILEDVIPKIKERGLKFADHI